MKKYTQLTKEQFDILIQNQEFKDIYNKTEKQKAKLEKVKVKLLKKLF